MQQDSKNGEQKPGIVILMKNQPNKLWKFGKAKPTRLYQTCHTCKMNKTKNRKTNKNSRSDSEETSFLLNGVKERYKYILKAGGTFFLWQVLAVHTRQRPPFGAGAAYLLPDLETSVQAVSIQSDCSSDIIPYKGNTVDQMNASLLTHQQNCQLHFSDPEISLYFRNMIGQPAAFKKIQCSSLIF